MATCASIRYDISQLSIPDQMKESPAKLFELIKAAVCISPSDLEFLQREVMNIQRAGGGGDGTSTAANFHEMISPRKITHPRDSYDGYDSPERKNTDSKHHMSGYSDDQIPRRKSLSERILEYKHRKLTEDNLEPQSPVGMGEYRQKTISKSADRPDHGSDEDYGHEQQMKRKKSLQERVAEFKEKRKNSQGAGLSPGLEPRTSLRGHGFERSEGHR